MILMPQECLQQKPTLTTSVQTPGTATSRIDEEMCKILNSTLGEEEKCLKYGQALQRYLRLRRELEQPQVSHNLIDSNQQASEAGATTTNADAELPDTRIVEAVPPKFRSNASQLLKRLRDNGNITWDKRGIIKLDGTVLHTNIIDLVNEAMRARKRAPPRGFTQFANILRQAGIPREFVGNDRLWQVVVKGPANISADTVASTVSQEGAVEPVGSRSTGASAFKQRKRPKLSQDTDTEEEEEFMDVEEEVGGQESQGQPKKSPARLKWIRMRMN